MLAFPKCNSPILSWVRQTKRAPCNLTFQSVFTAGRKVSEFSWKERHKIKHGSCGT